MLKKHSIVKFVFLILLAIIGIVLCVCPFNVPASTDRYNGLLTSIQKTMDLNGGTTAIYECEMPDGTKNGVSEAIDNSISKINDVFAQEKYKELYVTKQGEDKIRVDLAGVRDTDYVFAYLEDEKEMFMTLKKVEKDTDKPQVFVSSKDIAKSYVKYDYEASAYGIVVEFSETGKQHLEELKSYAKETTTETIYVYLGEVNSSKLFSEFSVKDLKDNSMFLKPSSDSSFKMTNAMEIRELMYSIVAGTLDVRLTCLGSHYVTPILGENTLLYIGISILVLVVLAFALLIARYGDLGALGMLSMIFFLVFDIFFLQAIPFIVLDLAGVIGAVLGFILAVASNVVIFEKIRDEYAIGKKIHISCKSAFKKSLWTILDSHFLTIIVSALIWIFAPVSLKCFGITLFLAALLSMFTSLVLTRWFINIYLPINSTKAKRMFLYRSKDVKEIKEEEVEIIEDADSIVGGGNND